MPLLNEAIEHVSMLERMKSLNAQYPSPQHEWDATKSDIHKYFSDGSIRESDDEMEVHIPHEMIGCIKVAYSEEKETARYTVRLVNYTINDAKTLLHTKYYLTDYQHYQALISKQGLEVKGRSEVIATITYLLGDIAQIQNRNTILKEWLTKEND